jgi:AsmA protein
MSFQDVGSRIVLGGGDAKLESARARLYGGEFAGSFHVKAAGDEPGLTLAGRASGLQLEPLIQALTGEPANFSGTGSFDLNLAGHGRTVIQNVQSAGGNVTFDMSDGAIKGFNLGRTLCAAYNTTQRAPAPPEQPLETVYQGIKGTAVVNAGTAQSSDLLARTSFMDINGAGTLKLVDQELDYDLDATLTGKIDIPNCETLEGFIGASIPFDISGTVTAPTILPDFSKLAQRVIRDELKDRVQDRLQDRLRDLLN